MFYCPICLTKCAITKLQIDFVDQKPLHFCDNNGDNHSYYISYYGNFNVELRINKTDYVVIEVFNEFAYILLYEQTFVIEKPEPCQSLEVLDKYLKLIAFT